MRYRITAPVSGFTGEVAGVAFAGGVAEADETRVAALAYFQRRGYTLIPITGEPAPAGGEAEPASGEGAPQPPAAPPAGETPGPGDGPPMPRKSASKADWVAYAVAHGLERAEAEQMTRDQLAEHFASEGADQ